MSRRPARSAEWARAIASGTLADKEASVDSGCT